MGQIDGYTRIITDETLRETACHGSSEYPFRYYLEDIWLFDLHCVDWHWHTEVEFVFVEKGTAVFQIGSGRHVLSAGMGVFINSQVIHRFEAAEIAVIPNIVFSPQLLSPEESLIFRKYIQPVLDSSTECLVLSPSVPWQKEAAGTLQAVFAAQGEESGEIKTVALLLKLWGILYQNMRLTEQRPPAQMSAHTRAQLQIMMQYIHENYPRRISLDDIAGTVAMSKSSVLNLFHRYLHISPVRYLVQYRLKRAARLLVTTESSAASIAQDTGFENAGYFTRKFKELFQLTPGEYRKRKRRGPPDSL